eukprot:CAMPEP_0198615574 /NCGR_PEP_ID=MMETSP1462-20131121/159462_1 /TAXON_ID=1333877 /ORGANISM="Brandtodinium nutriculum, Strain RCC3387" /LENGTH=46 /DNA_ID= /DNA_START= /DNA_END= /DNA_ORIENTATION=
MHDVAQTPEGKPLEAWQRRVREHLGARIAPSKEAYTGAVDSMEMLG